MRHRGGRGEGMSRVSAYTVTIVPVPDAGGASGGDSQVVIRVETGGPTPRITEMTVRAASAAAEGLSTEDLPRIDLEAVVRALVAGVVPVGSDPGAAARPATATQQGRRAPAGRQAPRSAGQSSAGQGSAGQGGDFVQTTLDTPGMEEPAAAPDGSTGGGTERSYRRMPGVAQLLADYERIGTVTGLAQHYGVPRHTAQGWMGRARKRAAQQAAGGSR